MKIKHFLLIAFAAAFTSCGDDNGGDNPPQPVENLLEKITDPVFLAHCQNRMTNAETIDGVVCPAWDTDKDGLLSDAEAAAVTRIDVDGTIEADGGVKSLDGIEHFTGLTDLSCNRNRLTSIDVSKLTELDYLICEYNQLTALDVTKNTGLTYLSCEHNRLTALDVSKNTVLEVLAVGMNDLATLDVSKNTVLRNLSFHNNRLSSLDISRNTALTGLDCRENRLTSLDVSRNTKLERCFLDFNPGDGDSEFPVTAWFDNDAIPEGFTEGNWRMDDKTITVDYRKAQ